MASFFCVISECVLKLHSGSACEIVTCVHANCLTLTFHTSRTASYTSSGTLLLTYTLALFVFKQIAIFIGQRPTLLCILLKKKLKKKKKCSITKQTQIVCYAPLQSLTGASIASV